MLSLTKSTQFWPILSRRFLHQSWNLFYNFFLIFFMFKDLTKSCCFDSLKKKKFIRFKIPSTYLIATLTLFLLSGKGAHSWKAVSLSWFQFFCLLQLPMLDLKNTCGICPSSSSSDDFFYISCDFYFFSVTKQ